MSCVRFGSRTCGGRGRFGLRALVLAVSAILLATAPAAAQEQPTYPTFPPHFAITNARVVPVSGRVIEVGTVVVRDGVIRAVGANVQTPADAWVIDGTGLTVYPGLIDAFTTLGQAEARSQASAAPLGPQRSGPQTPGPQQPHSWGAADRPGTFTWLTAADGLNAEDARIARWREAGFTSALTTRPQGLVTGEAAVINLAGGRGRELVVEAGVAQRVNLGGGGFGGGAAAARGYSGYPGSLMGILAYIKQLHLDARHYDQVWTAYDRDPRGKSRPEYDQALEPLRTTRPLLFPADDRVEIERAFKTGKEIGVPVIIYGAQRGYEAADMLRAAGAPVLVNLDWPKAPREQSPGTEPTLTTLRSWEHAPTTPATLQRAGVRFAFYTGGLGDPKEARGLVKRAIDAGLAPDAALRALTLAPAEILGVADRLGSIEVGKIANLLLADGDLFDPATQIRRVIVDGRPFELHEPTRRVASRPGRGADANAANADASPANTSPTDAAKASAATVAVPMATDRGAYRSDAVTLIRNATILTAVGPALEGGDVLVRNGKIAAVGKALSAPRDATVVDATGHYLIPGIVDAHSHTAAAAVNEGSVAVSAMVGMKDVIDPADINIYRALAGGVTTINLLHGSANPIGGRNAILKLRWGQDAAGLIMEGAPEGIKFALGENTKRTRNPARYPNSRMGVQDVIRQSFLDAREYMREWEAYEQARRRDKNAIPPRRDLELETVAEILRGERHVHAHSYRADEILQLLRVAEEFGVRIQKLQHVLEGYKVADEIARHGAGASTFSDWWAYKVEANDAIPHNAAIMAGRGVVVSINSDSDEEMRHLNQEVAKTIKWGGLSELQALQLITLNPAIQLGIQDRVGSIEVGKDADLALFKGHPFSMDGVVQQTYVDGKLFFDIELDRQRRAELQREKEALARKHLPGQAAGAEIVTRAADTNQDQEVER
jgi:imidazolonepropionase-like amidohydrolase